MQYFNNTLCITRDELVGGGFLSQSNYENMVKRDKIKTVRRGCRGTTALYEFESLPMDIKAEVSKKHDNIELKAMQEPIIKLLVPDYQAVNFYAKHILDNGENLKANTQREYSATAMVLNAVIKLVDDSRAWRKALGGSSKGKGSMVKLIEVLDSLKGKHGWKLPNSERGLRGKIADYRKNGYTSLISGKLCNTNAVAVADTEQEAALRRVMANYRNFDNAQVREFYNMVADAAGWKRITAQTVENYRDKWQIYADAGARGETHLNNTHAMQVKRRAPKSPMLYWTIDGWDVELLYQETATDRNGYVKTTFHNRLTAVVVLDPCCKYPIGYAIGTHETPELIKQALRNAVKHTEQLFGALYHPHQMQSDNYASKKLTPFYEALSEVYTPAKVKNAKAKVIEPYFKRLNKKYCQLLPNWAGFGITARKENQPNPEVLNKIRQSFPDEAGCRAQIDMMIAKERAENHDAYLQAWAMNPSALQWTKQQFLLNLGETNKRENTIRLQGSGINLQFNRQQYHYESFDIRFRKHRNENWHLYFDPQDMNETLAVNADQSLQFMLTTQYEQPMALAERANGDAQQLARIGDFNKSLKQDVLDVQQRDMDALQGLMERNPVALETLSKLLIVDSKGNHKDHKSNARLSAGKRLEIEEAKMAHDDFAQRQREYVASKINLNDFLNND